MWRVGPKVDPASPKTEKKKQTTHQILKRKMGRRQYRCRYENEKKEHGLLARAFLRHIQTQPSVPFFSPVLVQGLC